MAAASSSKSSKDSTRKNRLLIHPCDAAADTKILVLDFDNVDDIASLCKLAGEKLGKKDLTRAFLADGTEVTSPSELADNDNVYFSSGEKFNGASVFALADAGPSDEKEDKQLQPRMLTKLAGGVFNMASSFYGRSSSYAKDKNHYIKVTLERVEDTASKAANYANPLISRVIGVGSWADDKLDNAYNAAEKQRTAFLDSPLAQNVKENLIVPLKHRVVEPGQAFYSVAMAKFNSLRSQAADGKVDLEGFISGLRETLGAQWNEKLVEPAKVVHAAASKNLQSTRDSLGRVWHDKVIANFPPTLRDPAEYFYSKAMQSYTTLKDTAGDGKVTLVEYMAGLRVMLGSVWSERLVAPAKHLYEMFASSGTEDSFVARPAPWESSSSSTAAARDGDALQADDLSIAAFKAVESEIAEKLNVKGQKGSVVHYKTQSVAGMNNFYLKLKYDDTYAFARVFCDLQGNYTLHSTQANKSGYEVVQIF